MPDKKTMKLSEKISQIQSENNKVINLIPSENIFSKKTSQVLGMPFGQRYVFPSGGIENYWPSMGPISDLLYRVEYLAKDLFSSKNCSVRLLSGIHCMTVVLSFLKTRGIQNIYTVPFEFGGHGNTIKICSIFGLKVHFLPFSDYDLDVDFEKLRELKLSHDDAIYIDQWVSLKSLDIKKLRSCVGEHCYIHYDTSHFMGLIAGGVYSSPLSNGANSFGGSTHKTFPGPQKAILLWDNDDYTSIFSDEISRLVSHSHSGAIAALGVSMEEFKTYGNEYAFKVLENAKILASELNNLGLPIVGESIGFTQTHQIILDLSKYNQQELATNFKLSNISVNFLDSGILSTKLPLRLGVQEITFRGFQIENIKYLATLLAQVINGKEIENLNDLILKCEKNSFTELPKT